MYWCERKAVKLGKKGEGGDFTLYLLPPNLHSHVSLLFDRARSDPSSDQAFTSFMILSIVYDVLTSFKKVSFLSKIEGEERYPVLKTGDGKAKCEHHMIDEKGRYTQEFLRGGTVVRVWRGIER